MLVLEVHILYMSTMSTAKTWSTEVERGDNK